MPNPFDMEPNGVENSPNGSHENGSIIANGILETKRDGNVGKIVKEKFSYLRALSPGQMEALSALCDTYLPSIDVSEQAGNIDESRRRFYQTSATMAGTPHHLAWWITERLEHPKLYLSRLSLWLLSTWIGTFILCGRASLSSHFPYFQRFSQVSQKKREEIVLSWSQSYLTLIRILFMGTKLLTLLAFFTQVNDKNENISWKALGYHGPDPEFKNHLQKTKETTEMGDHQEQEDSNKEELFGPLNKGLIHLNQAREIVLEKLLKLGFTVSLPLFSYSKRTSLSPSFIVKCDAVVVGSGSGGGVMAGILAKAGYKVLVLEKGSYCARSNLSLLEGDALDKMYLGNGLLATKDMDVILLAGSTVGGGSTINWSASIKTPEHVTKEWCESYGLELFDSKLYMEAMDVVCKKMGVQSEVEDEGFNNMILRKGCQELGYPVENIPRNSPPDHYCGSCCLGCRNGRKKGTSETWLVDLVNSGNGVILPECEAIEVLQKQSTKAERSVASGVAFAFNHQGVKEVCIVKSKVTIVACGALGTPALLKRSGLKNPNVGKDLHLHPVAMAWGYFPDTRAPISNPWPESRKKSYEGGIMTAMSKVVADCEGSGYGAVIQTPSLHPGMFSVLMPWISGLDIKKRMCRFSRTAHIFALARDKGSGVVSPTSISYRMEPSDEENLKRGLEKVLRILAAAGAEEIGTHHVSGKVLNVKKASLSSFETFVKEESSRALTNLSTPICSAHQMGSCRMGVNAKSSVVNPMGETWEVEGLYIADSSVFPTALGVNPMVTIQAIAYCTAQAVLGVLRRKSST